MVEYSKEDLNKMENLLKESNALIARQEEIIAKIIEGEIQIGNTRVAQLDRYFDAYSNKLDNIAKKTSGLSDNFLILDNKIAENAKVVHKFLEDSSHTTTNDQTTVSSTNTDNKTNQKDVAVGNKVPDEDLSKMGEAYETRLEDLTKFLQKTPEEQRNDIEASEKAMEDITKRKQDKILALKRTFINDSVALEETLRDIQIASYEHAEDSELALTNKAIARVKLQQDAADAQLQALDLINSINAELSIDPTESGEALSRKDEAAELLKTTKQQADAMAEYEAKAILNAKRKNNGILAKEDAIRIKKDAAEKFKFDQENLKKLTKERLEQEARVASLNKLVSKDSSWEEKRAALEELKASTKDENGQSDSGKVAAVVVSALDKGIKALSNFAKELETKVDEIAQYKGDIDTRLQGSNMSTIGGSYWNKISQDMMSIGAVNPYFKQEDFANNIKSLVNQGIAFDLEQRAFLMTIQDKIANTFNVADGTLLRLIRIQQEDSTAGRLGMEAALNSFLNNMYETTEYLQNVASGVRDSLEEMQSLMEGAEAVEVEAQVQKWLGSLYSVGMSESAVKSISTALGQIAAGQIEGLEGGSGNLLVMAANNANVPIADLLTDGIDSNETNQLLQAVVNYLADLYESSENNKVVQQQLANVFGVKASDLKAATNLATSVGDINKYNLSYDNMLRQLYTLAGSMGKRTSMGEMMSNVMSNSKYSLASSMASTPVAYFTYQMASMLEDTTGGIPIPAISVMGNMVDLQTTLADLMRVGALGTGIIASLPEMISGLGNSFSGQKMLQQLGIESGTKLEITPRGDGSNLLKGMTGGGGTSTSESGYIGNNSESDIKNSTIQKAEDEKKKQMIEAKEEEGANQIDSINTTVLKIYELLDDVANGNGSLRVRVEGYGLTKAGNSSSGALGGVAALNSANGINGFSGAGVNSSSVSGSIDIGSWIMI